MSKLLRIAILLCSVFSTLLSATTPPPLLPARHALGEISLLKVDPNRYAEDYQALMQARLTIRQQLGSEWPQDDFTAEQSRQTLIDDLRAFENGENYTLHIVDKDGAIIGCLYLTPSFTERTVEGYYWLIPDKQQAGLTERLAADVSQWLTGYWPVEQVKFRFNHPPTAQ